MIPSRQSSRDRQSALMHRFCLKGSDLCSMALRVVPDCSTTLNDLKICGFDLSHAPVFKTKITVSKPPFLPDQLSRLFLLSRARSNALHSLGLYNGFSPLASRPIVGCRQPTLIAQFLLETSGHNPSTEDVTTCGLHEQQ